MPRVNSAAVSLCQVFKFPAGRPFVVDEKYPSIGNPTKIAQAPMFDLLNTERLLYLEDLTILNSGCKISPNRSVAELLPAAVSDKRTNDKKRDNRD
jgi:hypothetical protein